MYTNADAVENSSLSPGGKILTRLKLSLKGTEGKGSRPGSGEPVASPKPGPVRPGFL